MAAYSTMCSGNALTPDGRCMSCQDVRISYNVPVTASTNEFHHCESVSFTVTRTAEDMLDELEVRKQPRVVYRPEMYHPVVRRIPDEWKAKWRLRQQRPRDGLK